MPNMCDTMCGIWTTCPNIQHKTYSILACRQIARQRGTSRYAKSYGVLQYGQNEKLILVHPIF